MTSTLRVVGIGGSLAADSRSLAALRVALAGAREAGADITLFDVRALNLPMYVPSESPVPPPARVMADTVYAADGLIWSSPLYHGTVSGSFKNALDWLHLLQDRDPAYLTNKVIGLVSTAGGVQGLQAINTMEFAVRALRGWAVPMVMPIPRAWEVFDARGESRDERVTNQLKALGQEVVRAARQFASTGTCDYAPEALVAGRSPRMVD